MACSQLQRGKRGVLACADVADNIFSADVPPEPVVSIEAYDESGETIWWRPFVP